MAVFAGIGGGACSNLQQLQLNVQILFRIYILQLLSLEFCGSWFVLRWPR